MIRISVHFEINQMKYWQAKKLASTEFKRMTGVKKTFNLMVRIVKSKEKEMWSSPKVNN
ncbi:hypothetical protein NIES267_68400 [Calothrix parasitica NIES-267]|uniref:Uncharacterized protein n=1 Tax=Calothrix parasitica NIES-267 TaxID=1973488 RepID=A0A1Z4M1S0_9CYAN|nr:hypothetical protein NIES267_68400 [Calothrix parasitica NIES-267]